MTSFLPKVDCCFVCRGLRARKAHVIWRSLGSCYWPARGGGTPLQGWQLCRALSRPLGLSPLASHRLFRASLPNAPVEDLPPSTAHFLPAARGLVVLRRSGLGRLRSDVVITPHMQNRWAGFRSLLHHIAFRLIGIRCLTRRFIIDGATTNNTNCSSSYCAAPLAMGCQPVHVAVRTFV